MRTLYEVTANGKPVYNGDDKTSAERARVYWKNRGYTVELLTVDVPDIIDAEPAQAASFAVANPAATLTRKEALKVIWRHTHRDFRGRNFATGGSDKCVLILRAGGTCSVDLDALTDAEIADKLRSAWSAEQRRVASRDIEVITDEYEMAHGKKPRGCGTWAFFFAEPGAWKPADNAEPWFVPGAVTYSVAKKAAIAEAQKRGSLIARVGS